MSARGWQNWTHALAVCAVTIEAYGLIRLVWP